MKILLTGFEGFGQVKVNPSQYVVEELAKIPALNARLKLVTEILPTEYDRAGRRIRELIRHQQAKAIICLGAAMGADSILLERVALNLNDCEFPDNAGKIRQGRIILKQAPLAYFSSLPISSWLKKMNSIKIPAIISNHAGAYVCNHVFYLARHEVELLGGNIACGFIHLPLMTEQTQGMAINIPSLPLQVMLEAIACCLDTLKKLSAVK